MSRHRKLYLDKVEGKNVFRDILRIYRDTKFSINSVSQLDCVATEENFVAIKDEEERIEDWSRQRKVCRDSFQKKKSMRSWLQQILCRDTRHSYHDKNKTAASKLCRDTIKVYRDIIQEKAQKTYRDRNYRLRHKLRDKD